MAENKTKAQLEQELAEAQAQIAALQESRSPDPTSSVAVEKAIADAEAEADAIRQQARDEAAEIIKEAQAKAATQSGTPATNPATNGTRTAPVHDDGEDMVTVELFKDNVKYKDPLTVCVNGESLLIERGVRVKIKRKFLWAIQNQLRQDKSTAKMITAEADAFKAAQRAHGDA